MHVHRRRGWEIKESRATPEHVFLNRRQWLAAVGSIGGAASLATGAAAEDADPTANLYPAKRNEKYVLDRALTPEPISSNYNNFYEFGTYKRVAREAQALKTRPWTVKIDGMVEQPMEIGIDDLVRKMQLEERILRHRCVEAWAMAVPWTGFTLKSMLDLARPLGSAKYVEFKTFLNPSIAPGQRQTWYPWPYVEGVTVEEAANELSFMVTGAYGKPLLKQFGAPIRLALPWKYGFKHIKSIVQVTLTDKRPKSYWEALQDTEYGFWANVNPAVPHPRWSQATEEVLGESRRVPTLIWNGYGEYVAHMYKGLENERLFA